MTTLCEETADLVSDLVVFARRFVVLSEAQATAFSLWVLHTHAFDAAESTPYMAVTSAEKQSGKTRLAVEVAGALVANPIPTANATVAAVFRSIGSGRATLLFDEMDAIWSGKSEKTEELRGILNAGHKRGAVVMRCVGEGSRQKAERFSVFCPKALIAIGALPETIADRSIPIRLKRRAPHERIERARPSKIDREGARLRKRAMTWSGAAVTALSAAEPDLPDDLSDRAQDGAEPLIAIADLAGPDWGAAARAALVELHAESLTDTRESKAVRLLRDVRDAFDEIGRPRLFTSELIDALTFDEAGPWRNYHGRERISPRALANMLAPHEIRPGTVRVGSETRSGYKREDFEDAWARFLLQEADTSPTYPTSPYPAEFVQLALERGVSGAGDMDGEEWPF